MIVKLRIAMLNKGAEQRDLRLLTLPSLCLLFFLSLSPILVSGQDNSSAAPEAPTIIDIRPMADYADQVSMPDSLHKKYVIDQSGNIYKHFMMYEKAIAHFRGYYPRERNNVKKEAIYISTFSTLGEEEDIPDKLKVFPDGTHEIVD